MVAATRQRPGNAILANLPEQEWERIAPHLVSIDLARRQVLQEVDEPLQALYFPNDGILSLITVLEEGLASEGAVVGRYGGVDIHALFPGSRAPARTVVQIEGTAELLPIGKAREVMPSSPQLLDHMQSWGNYVMAQALQTAACNTAHPIRARLSRWLLEVADQLGRDSFPVTQEFLAEMIGVGRPRVTTIAVELQRQGAVRYQRGQFAIADREGFEAEACECYATMRARFRTLFNNR